MYCCNSTKINLDVTKLLQGGIVFNYVTFNTQGPHFCCTLCYKTGQKVNTWVQCSNFHF